MSNDTLRKVTVNRAVASSKWLLLMHQIPPKPAYLRVKIWRRLQAVGAVALKNSVYALPQSEEALEDFQWIAEEIRSGGGEASVCEASFVEGLSDDEIAALFVRARDEEYARLADEARTVLAAQPRGAVPMTERRAELAAQVTRLKRQLAQVSAIDFFNAPKREVAATCIADVEAGLRAAGEREREATGDKPVSARLRRRTWVTRKDVGIDRIASAWLIRRFIDREARFKFVSSRGYKPAPEEVRFDMFDAEFTHEGDRCTFEVLLERAGLKSERALRHIAEIVHDVDLKDGKFEREEAPGIARLVNGVATAGANDEQRLARGASLFDDLYESFRGSRR